MYLSQAIAQKKAVIRPQNRFLTIPAPVFGWNVRDSLEAMDPRFATILTNYIPRTGLVELRKGTVQHANTGEAGDVEFLHEHRNSTTTPNRKLLAAAGDKVFDVTTTSPVSLGTGFTSARWIGENFNNRTHMVNGNDVGQIFDGTALAAMTWTFATGGGEPAATLSDLNYVHQTKRRLFFAQNNQAGFWYGPVDSITGQLAYFPLEFVAPGCGHLKAIGTLTLDGGDLGIDDIVVFLMDSGDILAYAGTDPATAANWNLISRFRIGPPIGHKPIVSYGPDLIAITPTGYIPLTAAMREGRENFVPAVSDAIIGAVKDATMAYGNNFGWNIQFYPAEQLLIVNIPNGATCEQHVMNTSTRAWCRWTGLGAKSSALLNEELYLGCAGGIVRKYSGLSDDGNAIFGDAQTAWNDFGLQGLNKRIAMYRPIMSSDAPLSIAMGVGVDFRDAETQPTVPTVGAPAAQWDVDNWDVGLWGGGESFIRDWQSADERGDHIAVRIKTETTSQTVRWYSTDLQYVLGGPR